MLHYQSHMPIDAISQTYENTSATCTAEIQSPQQTKWTSKEPHSIQNYRKDIPDHMPSWYWSYSYWSSKYLRLKYKILLTTTSRNPQLGASKPITRRLIKRKEQCHCMKPKTHTMQQKTWDITISNPYLYQEEQISHWLPVIPIFER